MRRNKNITLNLKNITSHFTRKARIITLVLTIIMLSFVNIINTSALSYQSSVGVGFTFNPTLSVSISPSDLTIANLVPGNTLDSNVINVSVASNASYGYTLSVIMNGNNSNLTHSNGTNIFSSIATDADLADLDNSEDTNIWGYSYKDNTVEIPTWSNYSGLSSSNSATLLDTNTNNTETGIDSIDFKIAAKAASTQVSGTYTGVINLTAVTKPTPMNLAESYFAAGKTRHDGYYAMQDMTSEICNNTEVIGEGSQTELIDLRDDKVYWATKLADGHCWMTQNLDLDLSHDRPLTSEDTDLNDSSLTGAYSEDYEYDPATRIITWTPINTATTKDFSGDAGVSVSGWQMSNTQPYSANKTDDVNTGHLSFGNYYNWTAAIASNNSTTLVDGTYEDILQNPQNSICSKGWRLPTISNAQNSVQGSTNEFGRLNYLYNNNATYSVEKLFISPLYFARPGQISTYSKYSIDGGEPNNYWSSTINTDISVYYLAFSDSSVNPKRAYHSNSRSWGASMRCLAR